MWNDSDAGTRGSSALVACSAFLPCSACSPCCLLALPGSLGLLRPLRLGERHRVGDREAVECCTERPGDRAPLVGPGGVAARLVGQPPDGNARLFQRQFGRRRHLCWRQRRHVHLVARGEQEPLPIRRGRQVVDRRKPQQRLPIGAVEANRYEIRLRVVRRPLQLERAAVVETRAVAAPVHLWMEAQRRRHVHAGDELRLAAAGAHPLNLK